VARARLPGYSPRMRGFSCTAPAGVGIVVVLISALTGCDKIKERLGEKAAEALIQSQNGEKVDIDTKDGKLSVKLTDKDGTVTIGATDRLPNDFPKSVPVYPGAKVEGAVDARSDKEQGGFIVTLSTPDPAAKVSAFYKDAASKGKLILSQTAAADAQAYAWETADGVTANAVVKGEPGKTLIVLQGGKGKPPAAKK